MKIALSQQQYFDLSGEPLVAGRLKIHLHGSDNLADTFILSGNDFVEGPNPVILDNAGEQQNTIFVEAAIYDVEVEKFDNGTYAKISDFQFGFVLPTANNDTVVNGIAGLADSDPSLGFVTVVGYDNVTYAGPRMYMWDAQCTDAADGGCIIASTVEDSGRWLLISDLREMPSTFYGVEPGRESNISAFLTYTQVVGTHGIFMPPVPRFVTGTYTSEGTFSTTKTVSFDKGSKFTKATFYIDAAEITAPVSDYVADFIFRRQSYAESEWFRTVAGFWKCGASELHQSNNNHFAVTALPAGQTLVGNTRVSGKPMTITGSGALFFNGCDIADKALSTDWYTAFYNMSISDRWFTGNSWSVGQTSAYRQLAYKDHNTLEVVNFENADVYLLFASAWQLSDIDLLGRHCTYITADMPFTSIANGSFEAIACSHDLALNNVQVDALHAVDASFVLSDSTATLAVCSASSLTVLDSTLVLGCDIDTSVTGITMRDSIISIDSHKIAPTDGDWSSHNEIVLDGCDISSGTVCASVLYLHGSRLSNAVVKMYPYLQSGAYKISMDIGENVFSGSSKIAIGADNGNGSQNHSVYDVTIQSMRIVNNTFNTILSGLTCPFWAADGQHRFLRGIVQTMGWITDNETTEWSVPVYYFGNMGNCPRSYGNPSNEFNDAWHIINFDHDGDTGDSKHIRFDNTYTPCSVFCVPVTTDDGGSFDEDNVWQIDNKAKAVTPYNPSFMQYRTLEGSTPYLFPYLMYTPECAWDTSAPNDLFSVRLGGSNNFVFAGAIPIAAMP